MITFVRKRWNLIFWLKILGLFSITDTLFSSFFSLTAVYSIFFNLIFVNATCLALSRALLYKRNQNRELLLFLWEKIHFSVQFQWIPQFFFQIMTQQLMNFNCFIRRTHICLANFVQCLNFSWFCLLQSFCNRSVKTLKKILKFHL